MCHSCFILILLMNHKLWFKLWSKFKLLHVASLSTNVIWLNTYKSSKNGIKKVLWKSIPHVTDALLFHLVHPISKIILFYQRSERNCLWQKSFTFEAWWRMATVTVHWFLIAMAVLIITPQVNIILADDASHSKIIDLGALRC